MRADPARVVQVLINLLHNAVKFTPAGGESCVRRGGRGRPLRRGRHRNRHRPRRPAPHLRALLQSRTARGLTGGTGLGLAIAKHIVQAHGGQIWASSAGEGQGSSFAFTLPIAAEEAVEAPESAAALVLNGGAEAQVSTGVAAARGAR